MVIQDDAVVCQNFGAAVERIAEVVPDNPVCLFYPGGKMRSARSYRNAVTRKRPFFILSRGDFIPVVAVLWPREKVTHLMEWVQGRRIPGLREPYRSDDAVTGAWMRHTKQDVYVTLPSLVQHPDDVAPVKDGHHSAAHGADRSRIALSFCEGDALGIEWSLGSQSP